MKKIHTLSLTLEADEIEREPRPYTLKASDSELKELVERFDLIDISYIEAHVTVESRGRESGIFVQGKVKSKLVQKCIATLKEAPEEIDVPFALQLVSPEIADRMDEEEVYLDFEAPDYDALDGTKVEVGEIVAQTVAVSMNPYPRAADAVIDTAGKPYLTVNEPELPKENPFNVLSKLKDES